MAFENENSLELAKIQKNNRGEYVVLAKKTNKNTGNESLDIRTYYTDDDDQIMPTKKGLRFSTELAADVIKAMLNALETDELEDVRDRIDEILDTKEALNDIDVPDED